MKDREYLRSIVVNRDELAAVISRIYRAMLNAKASGDMNEYYRHKGMVEAFCYLRDGKTGRLDIGGGK